MGSTVHSRVPNAFAPAVYVLAAVKFAVTVAFAGAYGFHRDELYYLASAAHPQLGYVDYPPITPMLARLDTMIFGTGIVTLRLVPILAGTIVVILAGLIVRELGGGHTAQTLAAFAVLISGVYLGGDWLFETVAFDQLAWAIAIYFLVVLLRRNDMRLWLAIGVSLGVALEVKYTVVGLIVAIAAGLLLTKQRRHFATPWPWIASLIALAILAPNLIWQIQHGWPSLSYLDTHHGRIAHDTSRTSFVLEQLLFVNVALLPMVVAGVRWLFRSDIFRALVWIPIVVEVLYFAAGGKSYYATPMYVLLYAAGAVAVEPALIDRAPRVRWARAACPALVFTLLLLPIALPVLPGAVMQQTGIYKLRGDYGDMVGWPEFVRTIGGVYDRLPSKLRHQTQILVGNYGEAGAIDLYGSKYGLPQALSGHLTFYYWKPQHVMARALILVQVDPASLGVQCRSARNVATIRNSLGVRNEEWGEPVFLCRGQVNLDLIWHRFLHYD